MSNDTKRMHAIGCLQMGIAQCLVGGNFVVAKILAADLPTFVILFLRFGISAVLVGMVLLVRRQPLRNRAQEHLSRRSWRNLILQSCCAGFLFNFFLLEGLRFTSAINAGIITSLTPMMVTLFSALLLSERIRRHKGIAIIIGIMGVILLNLGHTGHEATTEGHPELIGDALILIALIPEALYFVLVKHHKENVNPLIATFISSSVNTLLFMPLAIWQCYQVHAFPVLHVSQLGLLCLYGGTNFLFYLLTYSSLEKIEASTAAVLIACAPMAAILVAVLWLSESLYSCQLFGLAFVLLSLAVGSGAIRKRVKNVEQNGV